MWQQNLGAVSPKHGITRVINSIWVATASAAQRLLRALGVAKVSLHGPSTGLLTLLACCVAVRHVLHSIVDPKPPRRLRQVWLRRRRSGLAEHSMPAARNSMRQPSCSAEPHGGGGGFADSTRCMHVQLDFWGCVSWYGSGLAGYPPTLALTLLRLAGRDADGPADARRSGGTDREQHPDARQRDARVPRHGQRVLVGTGGTVDQVRRQGDAALVRVNGVRDGPAGSRTISSSARTSFQPHHGKGS